MFDIFIWENLYARALFEVMLNIGKFLDCWKGDLDSQWFKMTSGLARCLAVAVPGGAVPHAWLPTGFPLVPCSTIKKLAPWAMQNLANLLATGLNIPLILLLYYQTSQFSNYWLNILLYFNNYYTFCFNIFQGVFYV